MDAALAQHYDQHNVKGLSSFIDGGTREGVRFVRLNPRFDVEETLRRLKNDEGQDPRLVEWLEQFSIEEGCGSVKFYALPTSFQLSRSRCYREGRLYGMDISSGAAVAALVRPTRGAPVKVLDLCCSPGLKLCMIADLLEQNHKLPCSADRSTSHQVVGVDISSERMNVCKSVVQKYFVDSTTSGRKSNDAYQDSNTNVQLFCCDGTTFGKGAKSDVGDEGACGTLASIHSQHFEYDSFCAAEEEKSEPGHGAKRKKMNKSARSRQRRRLNQVATTAGVDPVPLDKDYFDFVLVDAECSTDGAIHHLHHKRNKDMIRQAGKGSDKTDRDTDISNDLLTNEDKLKDLVDLQKRLIASGFRLLKPGGMMIYSTCSMATEQNEKVVSWLLEEEGEAAQLVALNVSSIKDGNSSLLVREGNIPGTIRFLPNLSGSVKTFGGGFFLARIAKAMVDGESVPST